MWMADCSFHPQINAYHDGELDGATARLVSEHLSTCAACREELAVVEGISRLFVAKTHSQMLPLELARLHQRLDGAADRGVGKRPAEMDFLRTAGMLSALAASIMVISGVWLAEFPSRHAAALSPGVAVVPASDRISLPANIPDWERTALRLRVEPLPVMDNSPQNNQIGLADAGSIGDSLVDSQVADWMVANLTAGGGHANP
jgi:hypothetical protein